MNVNKIQRLTEQHKALKAFHTSCCYKGVNLSVDGPRVPDATLTQTTTQLIIVKVRQALLGEIELLEKEIKKEAASG